jgi:regulator of nonsense transcripts 1
MEISQLMDRGSEELDWYNATITYPGDKFKGKSLSNMRSTRAASLSLNRFQRFQTEIVCGLQATPPGERKCFASVYSETGALLSFFMGGGTEIPHFGLQLRLTPKNKTKAQDFIMLWTAWDDDDFDSPRTPTYSPPEAAKFTFSASLTNVNLKKVELDERSTKACNGKSGTEAYEIQDVSYFSANGSWLGYSGRPVGTIVLS